MKRSWAERLYVLYKSIAGAGLGLVFATVAFFYESIGVRRIDFPLLTATYLVAVLVSAVPAGAWADKHGRLMVFRASVVIFASGFLYYALYAHSLCSALPAEVILGIGAAMFVASEQAWLTDTLCARWTNEERLRLFGKASTSYSWGMAIGGTCGTLMPDGYWRETLLLAGIMLMIAALVTFTFSTDTCRVRREKVNARKLFAASWNNLLRSRELKWAMVALLLINFIWVFDQYYLLFFRERAGGVRMTWVWLALYGAMSLGGIVAQKRWRIVRWRQSFGGVIVGIVLAGLGMMLAVVLDVPIWVVAMAAIHKFGQGLAIPVLDNYIQTYVESSCRSTFSSLRSLIGQVGNLVIRLMQWLLVCDMADGTGVITTVWTIASGVLILGAACLLVAYRPSAVSVSIRPAAELV